MINNRLLATDLVIRSMGREDIKNVVDIHLQAFQGFFLTFLGPSFLRELYSGILLDQSGIHRVCEQDGFIVGFVAGTDEPTGIYKRLLRARWWRFGLAALMPFLRQPKIIYRLFRAFSLPQESSVVNETGLLMSIAVLPNSQNKGIGKILIKAFLNEAAKRKLTWVILNTDKFNNDGVNKFYRSLGFKPIRSYTTPEGREMYQYRINV